MTAARFYGALHDRIPMVTPDEQRSIQEENAKDDERFWETMRDMNAAGVEEHKLMIASAATKLKGLESAAADAGDRVEAAKGRLERLARGENVAGWLGKRIDMQAMAKAAGMTPAMIKRARLFNSLTEAEFETLLDDAHVSKRTEASDKALELEARRIIRARN